MHGIEKRLAMRRFIEAGLSKSATARALGVSRRTLYNWIQSGELERDPDDMTLQYGPRPPRPTKLDPWKDVIDTRLSEFPQLAAATLFREVKAQGYPGGYGQVKRYVREVRDDILNEQRTNSNRSRLDRGPDRPPAGQGR